MTKEIKVTKAKVIKKVNYNKMLFHCWTGCSTVMYKQDLNNKIFGPNVSSCNDYALFLQVLKHMKNGMGYSECLTRYRVRATSLSRNKFKKLKSFFSVLVNIEKIPFFLSCFYLITNQIIKMCWKYKKSPKKENISNIEKKV